MPFVKPKTTAVIQESFSKSPWTYLSKPSPNRVNHLGTPPMENFWGSRMSWKVSCCRENHHRLDKEEEKFKSHFHKEGISLQTMDVEAKSIFTCRDFKSVVALYKDIFSFKWSHP